MQIEAKIIADSIAKSNGNRLTTFELIFPRIILPEVLTHRMFSRNTSSSRAIPFHKMLKVVQDEPFIPIAFQKHHKGMQGTEYLKDDTEARKKWLQARDAAVDAAEELDKLGITKQLCNRLLEPFMWTKMIISTTQEGLENFFELRCPKYYFAPSNEFFYSTKEFTEAYNSTFKVGIDISKELESNEVGRDLNKSTAEIHIQALAEAMYKAYNESKPKELNDNEWHIPYRERIDEDYPNLELTDIIKVSTSMVARVSYTTIENGKKLDLEKHKELYQLLIDENHSSPLEHCAMNMGRNHYFKNFKGFRQMREVIEINKQFYNGSKK